MGKTATVLLQPALQQGTYENYGSNMRSYFRFCDAFNVEPLTSTPVDVARYLAWLGEMGTIVADNLQPYLSAINRYLQDHALLQVALGPLGEGVRKGLAKNQEDTAPLTERVPLPVQVACSILELAKRLLQSVRSQTEPRVPLLCAACATTTSFVSFNRGE